MMTSLSNSDILALLMDAEGGRCWSLAFLSFLLLADPLPYEQVEKRHQCSQTAGPWNSVSIPWVQSRRRASVSWATYDRNRASAALGWVGGQDTGSLPLPGWSCSHIWGHGGEQESSYHSWLLLPEVEHARQCFHKTELEGGEEERNHGSDAKDSCSHQI